MYDSLQNLQFHVIHVRMYAIFQRLNKLPRHPLKLWSILLRIALG